MAKFKRYDTYSLNEAKKDENGYYHDSAIVGRVGLLTYYNADGTKRIEYRPPKEAFDENSLKTLKGVPVTHKHPSKLVNEDSYKDSSPVGAVLSEGRQDGNNIVADIIIYDLASCNNDRELSCGYTVETIEEAGTTPDGEHYDAIQTNIVYNHLAVVSKGRAGNARLNLDAEGNQCYDLNSENKKEEKSMKKINIDNKEYEVAEEVEKELSKRQAQCDAKDSEIKALKDQIKADEAKFKEDFAKAVKARIELEKTAEKYKVEKADEMDEKTIKVEVIKKVFPKVSLDGKNDAYVDAMFDIAKAQEVEHKDAIEENNKKMTETKKTENTDSKELSLENIEDFEF